MNTIATRTEALPLLPDEPLLQHLVKVLTQRLVSPRPLSLQVATVLADNYTLSEADYESFFASSLNQLDDYEIDLAFSPQFTPKLDDKDAVFAVVKNTVIPKHTIQATLIPTILQTNSTMPLVLPSGATVQLPLHEVMLERFITLLGLTNLVPACFEPAERALQANVPGLLPRFYGIIRHRFFQLERYSQFFNEVVVQLAKHASLDVALLMFLQDFCITYKPATMPEFVRQLNALIASCEADMVTAVERSYHNDEIKFGSAGSADDFAEAEVIRNQYKQTIALCQQVKEALGQA